jgi:hypothetical protein
MREPERIKVAPGRIRLVVTKGFAMPCLVYLMVGLALYPQLGIIAPMVGVSMTGQPSEIEWVFASVYFMLIGIAGVVLHEVGHALVLKYRHGRNALIALSAQVGTRHVPIETDSRLMAFCGPALQALYGIAILAVCVPTHAFYFGLLAVYIIADALYNLLPFKHYDGYHIFRQKRRLANT